MYGVSRPGIRNTSNRTSPLSLYRRRSRSIIHQHSERCPKKEVSSSTKLWPIANMGALDVTCISYRRQWRYHNSILGGFGFAFRLHLKFDVSSPRLMCANVSHVDWMEQARKVLIGEADLGKNVMFWIRKVLPMSWATWREDGFRLV